MPLMRRSQSLCGLMEHLSSEVGAAGGGGGRFCFLNLPASSHRAKLACQQGDALCTFPKSSRKPGVLPRPHSLLPSGTQAPEGPPSFSEV